MKTAISINDDLLRQADQAARRMSVSRSRFISLALEEYLRHQCRQEMLARLNQVYAGEPGAAERRTTARMKAKFRKTIGERW